MRRILVPLDGSPLSETAVPYAKALAAGTGCELSLLSVWEVLPEELEIVGEAHARVLRDQGMRYFRTYLTTVAEALEDRFASCEVRAGHPAFEIMLAAAELTRTSRDGGARRLGHPSAGGSVADKVLRDRACPSWSSGRRSAEPPRARRRPISLVLLDGSRESSQPSAWRSRSRGRWGRRSPC
jgi:nucleotide-binding universal stress UspA family protein